MFLQVVNTTGLMYVLKCYPDMSYMFIIILVKCFRQGYYIDYSFMFYRTLLKLMITCTQGYLGILNLQWH